MLVAAPFLIRTGIEFVRPMFTTHSSEEIKEMMEEHLYEKYGEEFVVDRLGTRTARDTEFYQARIYPKSIVGTNKEHDDYYHATVNIDKKSFGRLKEPGDTYGRVKMRQTAKEYLRPKAEELFGERIRLKPEPDLRVKNEQGYFYGYILPEFEEARRRALENPESERLELDLDIYVFDRIEDEEEKEERREDIFEFVQYLKEEGLYEYLELGVMFIDERILTSSYDNFENELRFSDTVEKEADGKIVEMPPMELREKMSREMQEELDEMSEEELLRRMDQIRKEELTYDNIRKYHGQYYCWIYSIGMLEENYSSSITEEDRETTHDKLEDIELSEYKKYIYTN